MRYLGVVIFLLLTLSSRVSATFLISNALGNHMVLKSENPLVWGFDDPGKSISVSVDDGNKYTNVTDANGVWRIYMPSQKNGGPHSLMFSEEGAYISQLDDIYFGAVFICGGQSNAQFSVSGALNATEEIADAINHPLLRLFTVGQGGGMSDTVPLTNFSSIEQNWTVASPTSVGNGDFTFFSALCYFFGRDLQMALGEPTVPIGLVSSNWGGTCLSSWTPSDGNAAIDCGMTGTSGHANLYNGLIAPLTLGPMSVDGFLWSQGECDADCNNTAYYRCAFPRFINDWRSRFNVPDAFFSFQVLPAYVNDSNRFNPYSLPYEREAQLLGLEAGGRVYAANTIDLGDALAPHGSVHPRNKQAVASRMTAAALALIYGDKTIPYASPSYAGASATTNPTSGDITVTVQFLPMSQSSGLLTLTPSSCPVGIGGLPLSECSWFEVQTSDGVWWNATQVALSTDSKNLILTVTGTNPNSIAIASRGFFSPWPVVVLYSQEGFPALPWFEPMGMMNNQ
jgi:sialate O-acetylesterase